MHSSLKSESAKFCSYSCLLSKYLAGWAAAHARFVDNTLIHTNCSINSLFCLFQSSSSQPQMMVVADLEDIFLPMPDDLLVNLSDSRSVVDTLLDSLPSMFQDNVNVESAFGPALKAAFMVMVCFLPVKILFIPLCLGAQVIWIYINVNFSLF